MKKMFFALMVMLTSTMAASAMSYEQARNEALFLTDKMAYELNLTDEQYEAAYEINLDYLMGVKYFLGSPSDPSIGHNAKASVYVPYGYGAAEDSGGYELFTNSHCMGLGTSFDRFITESELIETLKALYMLSQEEV